MRTLPLFPFTRTPVPSLAPFACTLLLLSCILPRTAAIGQQYDRTPPDRPSTVTTVCGMLAAGSRDLPAGAPNGGDASSGLSRIEAHSGAHLPTTGLIRGRVIFVQTKNDQTPDAAWPLGTLPLWADPYVARLHQYFHDMSCGTLDLQLDIHPDPMITRSREDEYVDWKQNFGHAIREILDSLDRIMDFGVYDLWDAERKMYQVQPGPDGRVDLLIFIFRSISNPNFLPFSGVSDLGFAGYHFLDGSLARWVYGGTGQFNDAAASGLTLCRSPGHSIVVDQDYAFRVTIHEFGHKLLGEGHPTELFGSLGVMGNAGNGYAMNSFERHLAGYIDYREVSAETDTVIVLRDYVTTGDAVLLPLVHQPRGYYALEYRTCLSEWDTAPTRGLYAFRLYDSWSRNQKEVEVISAEGKFEWELDSATNSIIPVRAAPLKGYSRFQRIPIGGKNYWADGWWGDPRAAFTPERPEFCVLKNPTPDFIHGSGHIHTNLHISLLAMDDSTATVRISYQEPVILDVSTPASDAFALASPYPNPLRHSERGAISLSARRGGIIRVRLVDALGREVRTLHAGAIDAGVTLIPIPADGLASGTYSVVLESAEGCRIKPLLITR